MFSIIANSDVLFYIVLMIEQNAHKKIEYILATP